METDKLLLNQFFAAHPKTAIQSIAAYKNEEIAELFEELSKEQCNLILRGLPNYKSGKIIDSLRLALACQLIEMLNPRYSQVLLRVTKEDKCEQILSGISNQKAAFLRRALDYPTTKVGAHLEPFVLTFVHSITAAEALALIHAKDATVQPTLFILDEEEKLIGYIELKELIKTEATLCVQTIVKAAPNPAFLDMSVSDLLADWDNSFIDLPVINADGLFLGTVSRRVLSELKLDQPKMDNAALKAGNALGELFSIGLTSLLGSSTHSESES